MDLGRAKWSGEIASVADPSALRSPVSRFTAGNGRRRPRGQTGRPLGDRERPAHRDAAVEIPAKLPSRAIERVAFNATGTQIAAAYSDGGRLWDCAILNPKKAEAERCETSDTWAGFFS
jgi:hypothetical protein